MNNTIHGNAKQYSSEFTEQIIDLQSIEQINLCINKIKENNQFGINAVKIYCYVNIFCLIVSMLLFYDTSYVLKALGFLPFVFFIYNVVTLLLISCDIEPQFDDKESFYTKWINKTLFMIEKLQKLLIYLNSKKIKENEEFINQFLCKPINQAKLVLPLCDLYYKKVDASSVFSLPDNLLNSLENKEYFDFCKYYNYVDKMIDDIYDYEGNILQPISPHNYYLYLKKYENSYNLNEKLENKLSRNIKENMQTIKPKKI